jgi:serine/threonine protein kinase
MLSGAPAPWLGVPAVGAVDTFGPYRVLKELGTGGMGAVYLAVDTRLSRRLALKVMLPELATNREARERFLREAKSAAKVTHDNVVTVYEADERDGVPYIAMQLLQGYPLDQFLKTKGPPLAHVVRIARETALGLAAAHDLGLVHRDIKPANLWLEAPNGRVKVLDFGLAKPVGTDTELTASGAVQGTPAFMSPEQARGLRVDHRTDLWSLGAVLYRLCTGRNPFAGPSVTAVLVALGTEEPTPVRELNPNVPEVLAELIHQLLAKQPEDRPQTAADVAERLGAIPVPSHPMPATVVPVRANASPENVFANLDPDHAEETDLTTPRGSEQTKGGKGLLVAAGAVALLAIAAIAAVVATADTGKKHPESKASAVPAPVGKAEPAKPSVSPPATFRNDSGMEFVKVPKGTGWLGGGANMPGGVRVEFKADFYLGKYEVTQQEWEKVTGLTPSYFSRTGLGKDFVKDISDADLKQFPVEMVSWDDCQIFIEGLNRLEKESGWAYRLPTEVEWEYACRGGPVDRLGSAFDFYFAKPTGTLLPEQANFNSGSGSAWKRTCQVGSYEPNALGLHDMHANNWEWCDDSAAGADGVSLRASRGGAWGDASESCRAANRFTIPPSFRNHSLGLRLARVPSAGK